MILILNEFQEFNTIIATIFSEMLRLWDKHKQEVKIHLIVSGSVYSTITSLFQDAKQPLFGRITHRLHLQAFTPTIIVEIMTKHNQNISPFDALTFFAVTGGIPIYVELLEQVGVFTYQAIKKEIFRLYSLWLEEGKWLLLDEFGKEYHTYFSILTLLSDYKT